MKESKPSLPELSPIVSVTPIYVIETSKKKKQEITQQQQKKMFSETIIKNLFDTKKTNLDIQT